MPIKDAEVQFYFDADILGLAHIVCGLRSDCTYPGAPEAQIKRRRRPKCVVERQEAPDREWIPAVADAGLVAITRDNDIQSHLSLLLLVQEFGLRLVTLRGPDATTPWGQLGITIPQWKNIESLVARPGPIVIAATRTGFRDIDIAKAIERIREGREKRYRQRAASRSRGENTLF